MAYRPDNEEDISSRDENDINHGRGRITMESGFDDDDGEEEEEDEITEDKNDYDNGQGLKPKAKIRKKTGGSGRRRIEIKFIENKSRRQVTFSRRKRGLMKKAYELTTLTGTQALVLIASETGHVYTFATPKLQPVVTLREGKELIQSCLNAPENSYPPSGEYMPNTNNQPSASNSPIHQTPKAEPHSSPPMSHPQHSQHAQHPHHHDPMMGNIYGGGLPAPHSSPYPAHMPGGFPHDMYMQAGGNTGGGQSALPSMMGGQHLAQHEPNKRTDM